MVHGGEPRLLESCMNNPNQYWGRKVGEGQQQLKTREEQMEVDGVCTKHMSPERRSYQKKEIKPARYTVLS